MTVFIILQLLNVSRTIKEEDADFAILKIILLLNPNNEQLKADALENAPEIRPAVIQGMSEVMREMKNTDIHIHIQ